MANRARRVLAERLNALAEPLPLIRTGDVATRADLYTVLRTFEDMGGLPGQARTPRRWPDVACG